jgi:MmpS family membrane protein
VPLRVGMSHVVRDAPPVGVPRRSPAEHVRAGDMVRAPESGWRLTVARGDSDSIGCRIVLDGVVKAEKITHEVNALPSAC